MKREILGFKQEEAIKNKINSDELLILSYIEGFINSGTATRLYNEEDNTMYYWIAYSKILEDLPILNISRKRLSRIINYNLCEKPSDFEETINNVSPTTKRDMLNRKYSGMLKCKIKKDTKHGTMSYFALTEKFFNLKENFLSEDKKVPMVVQKSPNGGTKKSHLDGTKKSHNIYINIYKDIVEYLNEKAHKNYKYSTDKTQELIHARLREGFVLEDFKRVIDIKTNAWRGTDYEIYLRPTTLFGTKFEGYLNEAPKNNKRGKLVELPKPKENTGLSKFEEL